MFPKCLTFPKFFFKKVGHALSLVRICNRYYLLPFGASDDFC